jgi:hypothetical protein
MSVWRPGFEVEVFQDELVAFYQPQCDTLLRFYDGPALTSQGKGAENSPAPDPHTIKHISLSIVIKTINHHWVW